MYSLLAQLHGTANIIEIEGDPQFDIITVLYGEPSVLSVHVLDGSDGVLSRANIIGAMHTLKGIELNLLTNINHCAPP
jgi:hypothetical protein